MSKVISKQLILGKMVEDKQVSSSSINVKSSATSEDLKSVGESIKTLLNGDYNLNSKTIFSLDGAKEEITARSEFDKESDWSYTLNDNGEVILNKLVATSLNSMSRSVENIVIPSVLKMNDGQVKNVVKAVSINDEPLINNILSQKARIITFKEGIKEVQGSIITSSLIEQIIFADTITSLDDRAVSGCNKVKYIKYPKEYVTLPNNQFENSKMTEFSVSDGINKIGQYCFSRSNIERIDINNVEIIDAYGFQFCRNLREIDLSKVKTLAGYTFSNCSSLEVVHLDNIEQLGYNEFTGCTSLRELTLGKTLRNLPNMSFANTPITLKEIVIPNSVESITHECFGTTTNLEKIKIVAPNENVFNSLKKNTNYIDKLVYISEDGETLPSPSEDYVRGEYYPIVDEIDRITEYTDVYTQWEYEEDTENEDCVILRNMTQEKLDYYENHYGESEQMLIIPNKLRLENGLVKDIKKINSDISALGGFFTRIIICEGIEEILDDGLNGMWANKIKFPVSLRKVGARGLKNLECEKVDLVGIDDLGTRALQRAKSRLLKINAKNIPQECFYDSQVETVVLGEDVLIGESCFENNKKLKAFEFTTIENIGRNAFKGCTALSGELNLEGVSSMNEYCFKDCTGITSINIGSTLRHLPEEFFYGCNVKEIVIPNTITSVHETFMDYDKVTTIYVVAPNKAIYDKLERSVGDFIDIKYVNEGLEEVPVI